MTESTRKTGKGSRIKAAKEKGAKAFADGTAIDANPYKRPNMARVWADGWEDAKRTAECADTGELPAED